MNPQISKLQNDISAGVRSLGTGETQWRTGDDPARWSIQQILEHLLMTYDLSSSVFERQIGKGVPTQVAPTLRQRVGQWVVLGARRFPKGREAPAMVVPAAAPEPLSGESLVLRAEASLRRFDGLAATAEGMFGNRRSITHAVLGPLSVSQWRRFHAVHGEHHLKQIGLIVSAHRR